MKTSAIYTLFLAASLSVPAMAQTSSQPSASDKDSSAVSGESRRPSNPQYGEGGSKHCDQLSGAEKQTCLQDEDAKTDRKTAPDTSGAGTSAPGGRDADPEKANPRSDSAK